MHLLKALFFYFVTTTSCESDKVLLKFKSDVDKVGQDVENLVFDIVKKIVDDVGVYEDYYASDELTTQHSVKKKILNDVENTTEQYDTEKTDLLKKSTQYEDVVHNRLKRTIDENSSSSLNQSEVIKPVTDSPITNDTSCTKSQNGQALETHHIDDLKDEIKKLQDLVVLLRDQQKIISLLDKNTKNVDNDLASRFGTKDILKLLDYVNTKDIQEQKDYGNSDLLNIKNDLKEAIATLNKTRHILTMERKKDLLLERELTDQKLDISFLKMMMQKLYKNSVNGANDNIVGSPLHLPKELPDQRLSKTLGDPYSIKRTFEDEDPTLRTENSVRASDLDDLERLVRKLNKPKKSDIESKIFELQQELDKKKQEEDALIQLKLFKKYLDQRKKEQTSDSESEMIKKFQHAMKTTDESKSRTLDDEIELELEKLQEAIDNLKPNDEQDSTKEVPSSADDTKRFQMMLKKMFGQQNRWKDDEAKRFQMYDREGKREEDPMKQFQSMLDKMANQDVKNNVRPSSNEQNVLLREIIELRKQLASNGKSQFGSIYNYRPSEIYTERPYQMGLTDEGLNNGYPTYPPYMNPGYQNTRGQIYKSGDNDQHYTNHFSSPDYPKPNNPNILPTYSKSGPQEYKKAYEGSSNQNNQYNFEQNPYQTTLGPNHFNMGSSGYQSFPEYKDFGIAVPPYRYNPEANANFQPLAELHEIPFTISVLPNQKALNLEANPMDDIYKPGHNLPQQDRSQFFLTSHTKSAPGFVHHPESPPGGGKGQPGAYTPKTGGNVGHVYQRVEDLKAQIYNLQSIIDGLNKPNYTQTLQDKETIVGLEKQISDLKGVINNINSGVLPSYTPLSPNDDHTHIPKPPSERRIKKSVENNVGFDEDSQLYDQVASGLKKLIFEKEDNAGRSTYDDLQGRIDDLKYQLESRAHSEQGSINPILTLNNYQPPYYQRNFFTSTYTPPTIHQFEMTSSKKNDIFTALVIKILDKLIASTPAIVERLFGQGLTELSNFEGYGYNVGNGGQNDVQNLMKSLGVFGYGPLIFLRLIDGFTTFMNILRRNEFFKNFLTPALILLLVSGAVVFLVWWLQPDPKLQPEGYYDKYNGSYSNYNYHSKGYGNNNYNYGYKGSYGSPVYSRSYLDDIRQRSRFT